MISNELINILICPETQQPLKLADAETLATLNQAASEGRLVNASGQPVTTSFDAGLVREDGTRFYPVIDDIPVMLVDDSISLEQVKQAPKDPNPTNE